MALGPLPGPLHFSLTLSQWMIHPDFPYYLQLAIELPLQNFSFNFLYDSIRKFGKSCIINWLVQKSFFSIISFIFGHFITQNCISQKCTIFIAESHQQSVSKLFGELGRKKEKCPLGWVTPLGLQKSLESILPFHDVLKGILPDIDQ